MTPSAASASHRMWLVWECQPAIGEDFIRARFKTAWEKAPCSAALSVVIHRAGPRAYGIVPYALRRLVHERVPTHSPAGHGGMIPLIGAIQAAAVSC